MIARIASGTLLIIFSVLGIGMPMQASALGVSVPDSLVYVKENLVDIKSQAISLELSIFSQDDYDENKTMIEVLEKRLAGAEPYLNEPDIASLYGTCKKCLDKINDKPKAFRRERITDSLSGVLSMYEARLDSLLNVGHGYESRKLGDSVKVVKSVVDREIFTEMQLINRQYKSNVEESDELKESMRRIDSVSAEISSLSEKTKPKVGDIILKILIVAGVLTMAGNMIYNNSKFKMKKMKKEAEKEMKKTQQEAEEAAKAAMESQRRYDI